MKPESKCYSWEWVTADRCLVHGECELVYARSMTSNAESDTYLRNGVDSTGKLIFEFEGGVKQGDVFNPKVPVYCDKGLYIDIGTNTIGIFVQWRKLDSKGE